MLSSTRPNRASLVIATWRCSSSPAPSSASDTALQRITAKVMVRLRRRPEPASRTTGAMRIMPASRSGSVDAAGLVPDEVAVVELDHATAHRVDDLGVVGGHDHGRAGPVDPVEQPHDAHAGV